MKNVLMRDTFREIKHSVSRFLSIFTIIALGVRMFFRNKSHNARYD